MQQDFGALLAFVGIAVIAIFFLPYVLLNAVTFWRAERDAKTRRALAALVVSVLFAVAVGVGLSLLANGLQTFDRFGLAKRLTLPVVYGLFAVSLLSRIDERTRRPAWWGVLLVVLGVSTVAQVVVPRQQIDALDLAQSVVLSAGLLIAAAAGMRARVWSDRDIVIFVAVLGVAGLAAQFLGASITPFDVVKVPAGFALLYLGLRWPTRARWRGASIVAGLVLVGASFASVGGDKNASIALVSQVGVCTALFIIRFAARTFRTAFLLVGGLAAAVLAIHTQIVGILFGVPQPGWDVTLTHRAYEARAVTATIGDPVSLIFGGGPGATVNLSQSPDVSTLRAAGRDVTAVDDVHLLTSWVLLKFGVLGLFWLAVLLVAVARQAIRVMRSTEAFSFDFVLLLFVMASVVTALPAATFLFSNPLMAFCLGALAAREVYAVSVRVAPRRANKPRPLPTR